LGTGSSLCNCFIGSGARTELLLRDPGRRRGIMGILWYILVLWLGIFLGFFLHGVLGRIRSYDGTIVVTHEQHRTLYSLELEDYPDKIEFKKEVILKVDASDENLNRE
jgi:hypothetical protein